MKKNKISIQLYSCVILLFLLTNSIRSQMIDYSKATIVQTSKAGDKLADKGTFDLSLKRRKVIPK
jgi:hypothetical protein